MPIVFRTRYSTYHIDTENKSYHRVVGVNAPTVRQGADNKVRFLAEVPHVEVGQPVTFVYDDSREFILPFDSTMEVDTPIEKMTITSTVLEILESD